MPSIDNILSWPCTALKVAGHISKQLFHPTVHNFSLLKALPLIVLHEPMHLPCMIRAVGINLSLRSSCCGQLTEKARFRLHLESCSSIAG